jgi:hypothetical protein
MNARVRVLKQLVADSMYPMDESLIAAAIVQRALARRGLADPSLLDDLRESRIRSVRVYDDARSFRPTGMSRRRPVYR